MSAEYTYKGKVFFLSSINDAADANPLLKIYKESFKEYWLNGFSPIIGKDIPTSRPNPPAGHRHVHLQPLVYPTDAEIQSTKYLGYSDSEKCWEAWANSIDTGNLTYPTSDSCLFYMVDTERTAYVFHYQAKDSHNFMNSADFTELVHRASEIIDNTGKFLMDWSDHHTLFDDKWLEPEPESE